MKTCNKCGAQYDIRWHKLADPEMCFRCNHWKEQADHPEGAIRVDGGHYRLPNSFGPGACGMTIRWKDTGKVEHLTGLWYQGEIPEVWRDVLPDNAERVSVAGGK